MPLLVRILAPFTLIVFLLTINLTSAHAITTPLDKAQEDYAYQLAKYVELKDKYQTAKSSYLTFKTATSKNEAFSITKDYLKQIDNVYQSYLLLVEERTNSVNWGNASVSREELHKKLEEESKYFDNNKKDIDATQTLENLPLLAKNIQTRIETKTFKIAFDTLAATNLAQMEHAVALFHSNYKLVDDLASAKIQDKQLYNNWKTDLESKQINLDKEMESLKMNPKRIEVYDAQRPKFSYDTQKSIEILLSTKSILREILKFI